jgi:sec-independent protein translocase protein TatB
MFNIGGGEVLVIALVALIVLGPQRLPDAARQVGKAMGELRRLSSGFQNEIKGAFDVAQISPKQPTPRRTPLTAAPDPTARGNDAVADAVAAVSHQPPARRTPLKAAPVKKATRTAPPAPSPTTQSASRAPKATGPRSKGS